MERWLQEPWAIALGALVAVWLLWIAAGALLRWLDKLAARTRRDEDSLTRGRVTRPFLWDESEREHLGRVRIGVEIWRARCSAPLAERIQVGDRVWLRRHERLLQVHRTETKEIQ